MRSDIEIAQSTPLQPIARVAEKLGLGEEAWSPTAGMAKLHLPPEKPGQKRGKLILVTAINPPRPGRGKTTTSIGLADALNRLGRRRCCPCGSRPWGPVFGMKGGATGGAMPGRSHGTSISISLGIFMPSAQPIIFGRHGG